LTRSAPEANAARIELGRLLLKPLNAELADTRRLFVSPDGPVAQIPLAILPTADSDYLLETTTVSCATSARQWLSLRRNDQPLADHSILAVGGITYADDVGQRLFGAESALDADQLFLVGSALELRQAGQLFSQSFPQGRFAILQGKTATKTSLQDALKSPPRYLHLATHGIVRSRAVRAAAIASDRQARYFGLQPKSVPLSAEPAATSASETAPPGETDGDTLWVRLPRLRSALLLADERQFADEGNTTTEANDLLTAEEVMSLDLNGVELVVLSACDTGLGDLQNGQGVIGLQRSFGMAGARSSIGSLWAVDDAATSLLFERFYRALWQQKLSVAESLRQAQLYVLKNPAAVHRRTQQLEGTSTAPSRRQRQDNQRSPVAWWGSFVTYGI